MIRCLVVDDARAFRALLRQILSTAPGVEVVGEAANGREAVTLVRALRPDVVTMDVHMPDLDGIGALEEIMRVAPTPVVVVSAEAGAGPQRLSFRALEAGAVEVLAKPRDPGTPRFARDAEAIRQAVRAVAGLVLVGRRRPAPRPPAAPGEPARATAARPARELAVAAAPVLLAVAASTGGPAALAHILARLPRTLAAPIVVAQHLSPGFDAGLASWLASTTPLAVRLAEDGAALAPGTVYLGPDGRHVAVRGGRIRLEDDLPVHGFRPSGTHLFASVARELGPRGAGLVLTGMGSDGAAGLALLRRAGGWTAAQGEATSVVFGMPRVALETGAAAHVLELDDIADAIVSLLGGGARRAAPG
jgi:two-component system, chemotaxis family, protein-glutamate methylesterase/glutaminase